MMINVKDTFLADLSNGERVLVLLAASKEEYEQLYHYLVVDAYQFKHQIAKEIRAVNYISAGYRTEDDEVIWNKDYIPVPQWYDMN